MGLMARMGPIHWAVGATALLRCSTRVVLAVDTERIKLQVVSQFGTRRELGVGVVFFVMAASSLTRKDTAVSPGIVFNSVMYLCCAMIV